MIDLGYKVKRRRGKQITRIEPVDVALPKPTAPAEPYDCYSCKYREALSTGMAHCHKCPQSMHSQNVRPTKELRLRFQEILRFKQEDYPGCSMGYKIVDYPRDREYPYKFFARNILACTNYEQGPYDADYDKRSAEAAKIACNVCIHNHKGLAACAGCRVPNERRDSHHQSTGET